MKRKRKRRGVSPGTVTMLVLTVAVLAGYCALLPTFTGNQDIRINASELAVAIDESFAQLAASAEIRLQQTAVPAATQNAILPQTLLATPEPVVTIPPKLSFSLCATGSIVLNAKVQQALTVDDAYRFDILTDQLAGALQADLSVATLEHTIIPTAKLTNVNLPAQLLPALRSTGINALSLGHLNALNSGVTGLSDTMQSVASAGMTPYGMYSSAAQRSNTVIMQLNGVRVALLAYQDEISSTGRKQTTEEERAFAYAPVDLEVIRADIQNAKAAGAQVVVVSLCWGKVGASSPTVAQQELAQSMANAGADIILGTHSGALQPVRVLSANRGDGRYHPVLCAYSLGNLVTHDREKRANLASILLKANVVYDMATDTVGFDDLTYTPTYAWRGKDNGKTRYRILLNTGGEVPDFVDKDQQGVMQRCFNLVNDVMADTSIPMAP